MYEEEPMESVIVKKEPDNFMDSQATDDCFDDAFDNDLIVDFESQSSSTIGKNEEGIPSTPDDWKQQEIKVQSLISEPNLKDSCTKNGPEIVNIKDSVSREWDELYSNSVEISSSDSGALSEVKHAEYIFDSTKLPLETNEKGEAVLRFFWIDAFEDYFRNPGERRVSFDVCYLLDNNI